MSRGYGEGSVYLQREGVWAGALSIAPGVRRTYYGKSRKAVQDKLNAALRDHELGILPSDGHRTVADVLTTWLEVAAKPKVRPKTYQTYCYMVNRHLIPALGSIKAEKLRPEQVQAMLNAKAASLSPRTVHHLRTVLRTALGQAVKWGIVPRNVASLTDPPRVPRKPVPVLSPAEAGQLLAAATGHPLGALITVALALGLRQGEALALRWQDVDLQARQLHVEHSLQRMAGQLPELVEPKTEMSRRTITIPSAVVQALREHRPELAHPTAFVFAKPDGSPLEGTTVTKIFQRLLRTVGLPRLTFHGLRHSCASLLLAQGVSAKVIQETLGHSTIATTMDVYAHLMPSLRQDAADAMDRVLGGQ